jgi:hypothetical protein
MQIRLKTLRYALAAAVCGVLAMGPGFAQEKAPSADAPPPKAGSDAPRGYAAGAGAGGGGATKSGSDAKAGDAGTSGDRATVQNHPASPQTIELSKDAGHKGTPPATTTLTPGGPTPGSQNVTSSHGGINLVTPDNGYANLLRRANRKALIANVPKKPSPLAGAAPKSQITNSSNDVVVPRNAVGLVMPPPGTGQSVPAPKRAGGIGIGAIGNGLVGGAVVGGSAEVRHLPPTPSNAAIPPTVHTAGVNGTTMGHIASGPSMIGGPAKDRSGINGTTVRPRY